MRPGTYRSLFATLLTVVLLGPVTALVATAGPANAATATTITGQDGGPWITASSYQSQPGAPVFGDTLDLNIQVYAGTDQVYDGTLLVEMQPAGSDTWKTVATSDSAYLYDSVKAVTNAVYRVTYSGTDTYDPAQSSLAVKVQRKLDITGGYGRQASLKLKVSPKAKLKVIVFKKHGKKWKKYKTTKTNSKGKAKINLPAPKKGKYYWRLEIKKSGSFTTTYSNVYYTKKL